MFISIFDYSEKMKNKYFNNFYKICYFILANAFACNSYSQKFTEPDKLKQFNITVNYEDYTVKTQMLSQNKAITVNNDRVYMWYGSQKIIETKGGFDGKLIHGKYNAFYLNNQLKEQGQVKYGLKNKEWKCWYPDGKLREVVNWKNGVKNGSYSIYNDYGQLMAKGKFKKDKLDGKFYTYGSTGNVTDKKVYKNGDEVIPKVKVDKPKKEKKAKKEKPTEEKKPKPEKKKKRSSEKTTNTPENDKKVITS